MNIHQWRFTEYYDAFLRWIVPSGIDPQSQQAGIYKNLVNLSLLSLLIVPCFIAAYFYIDARLLAGPLLVTAVFLVSAPFIFKFSGNLALAREFFIIALFAFKTWESVLFGGIVSPGSFWFIASPVVAILLGGVMSAVVWLLISIGTLVGLQLVLGDNVSFVASPVNHPYFLYTFSLVGMFLAVSVFVMIAEHERRKAFSKLEKANVDLAQANQTIHELAIRDALTGSYNRRHVWNEIAEEEKRSASRQGRFCICLIDLDRFKSINDNFGHATGDQVLQAVARTIQGQIRQGDCFGRYGGEEFILMLKDMRIEDGRHFAERIRQNVGSLAFADLPKALTVTVSIGIAEYQPGEVFTQTINRADQALYVAKHAGRNQVAIREGMLT